MSCGASATIRWAAFLAFSTLSPASNTASLSLAPPRDLMPPCWLMVSIARSAAIFITWPWRAQGPDIGAISPTSTSGRCASARQATNASEVKSAIPTVRCAKVAIMPSSLLLVSSSHAQIRLPYAIVARQLLVRAFQHRTPRFQDVAAVGVVQRFGDALLDQQDRESRLRVDGDDALED